MTGRIRRGSIIFRECEKNFENREKS